MVDKKALWTDIACHFGLKLNEVFRLSEMKHMRYQITKEGLQCCTDDGTWEKSRFIGDFLAGELGEVTKLKWRPSIGESYYYVALLEDKEPMVLKNEFCNISIEIYLLMLGNIFRTKEEAEKAIPMFKEKLKENLNAYGKV